MGNFRDDLARVLNHYNMEGNSNTPDRILADYLQSCLDAFDKATTARENWYGWKHVPGQEPIRLTDPANTSNA